MGAIQKKGVLHALEFCNVQAMPLTDSMATVHNTKIKRVSDKNINPGNKANSKEIEYINNFKEMVSSGAEPQPIIDETDKKVDFYYPITTNDMCLKCHGTVGKELKRETYDKILELYPDDKAIGYDVNEVRGIWSISFEK
ncbi:MAG: Tll0287-like domain-containing protein [Bacteroidota bacterium]